MVGEKYEIYIGLIDQDKYEEIFDVDSFAAVLSKHCSNHKMGFSLTTQLGGYSHNKGYVVETSLKITLIGVDEKIVSDMCDYLKELINTDTVLVTKENVNYDFK